MTLMRISAGDNNVNGDGIVDELARIRLFGTQAIFASGIQGNGQIIFVFLLRKHVQQGKITAKTTDLRHDTCCVTYMLDDVDEVEEI